MKIRKAIAQDAAAFVTIKNNLSFKNVEGSTTKGGFLLGTDLPTYQHFIKHETVLVAEANNKLVGFGIVLNNSTVKQSDIWQRRTNASWLIDIEPFKHVPISYFEQLAFLPGYSRMVVALCYQIMQLTFTTHKSLFTTTVHTPINNLAAVPYILRAGGAKIGQIQENYPVLGQLISDIYKIDKKDFETNIVNSNKYNFMPCTI